MTGAEHDAGFVRRAVELARAGWGHTAPNPLVGCVVARDGAIVGEGWHTAYGHPHAEVEALRAAGAEARGATAYVTLEPCSHHGRTPPCVDALLAAGVARVVFGAADPNPVAGGGAAALRARGVRVDGPIDEAAIRDLDPVFFHRHGPSGAERPWIALKLAMSLDGRIADAAGRSVWITGEEARHEVHRLRAGHDAVGVGVGTAIADDPLLTVRGAVTPRVPPARVVFDRTLRLPASGRLAASSGDAPVIALCEPGAPTGRRRALESAGVRIVEGRGLAEQLRALRGEGVASLMVEGGSKLAASLLAGGAVDRMYLFYAPVLIGPGGAAAFGGIPTGPLAKANRWRTLRMEPFGSDALLILAGPGPPVS
jgi:diaminohydroxyphosphoribosylaminopyrimidine deaminase / 5-amino-6-(5-phosphoribosylamino)uracil reductase